MDKRKLETQWKKLFRKYNVNFEYKRYEYPIDDKYTAKPSFYLPDYNLFIHVGNKSPDNLTKDAFVYMKAVHQNLIDNILITSFAPYETTYGEGILFNIKEERVYKVVTDGDILTFVDVLSTTQPKKSEIDKFNELNNVQESINLSDIEAVIDVSQPYLKCVPITDSSTISKFHPKYSTSIEEEKGKILGGITSNYFVIQEGILGEKYLDESIGVNKKELEKYNISKRFILIQGNQLGEYCFSLYYYYIKKDPTPDK